MDTGSQLIENWCRQTDKTDFDWHGLMEDRYNGDRAQPEKWSKATIVKSDSQTDRRKEIGKESGRGTDSTYFDTKHPAGRLQRREDHRSQETVLLKDTKDKKKKEKKTTNIQNKQRNKHKNESKQANTNDKTKVQTKNKTRQQDKTRQDKTQDKTRHMTRQDTRQDKTQDKTRHKTRQDTRTNNLYLSIYLSIYQDGTKFAPLIVHFDVQRVLSNLSSGQTKLLFNGRSRSLRKKYFMRKSSISFSGDVVTTDPLQLRERASTFSQIVYDPLKAARVLRDCSKSPGPKWPLLSPSPLLRWCLVHSPSSKSRWVRVEASLTHE